MQLPAAHQSLKLVCCHRLQAYKTMGASQYVLHQLKIRANPLLGFTLQNEGTQVIIHCLMISESYKEVSSEYK